MNGKLTRSLADYTTIIINSEHAITSAYSRDNELNAKFLYRIMVIMKYGTCTYIVHR